ncbi:ABC transporter permease [Parapedobacter sp. DT-150]|uniref:ABC transporter permease n=1 Tax=Parapedobacter sp. DT-150 TaxID=3396162 RepID=UPI003F1A0F34
MIKTHLKTAWRNLIRHRLNSFIYIAGLAIALLCVVFIGIYIEDERSFDRFLPDADRIYRVNLDGKMGPEEFVAGNTPPPVGKALSDNFPEVTDYTRLYLCNPENISYTGNAQKKMFTETRLFSVDSNFLSFFQYRLLEGDATTSLQHPYSVVLTARTAKKYFGNEPAIGKRLQFDEWSEPFVVTGVLEDLPSNSSLQFDLLMPNSAMPPVERFSWSWVWLQMNTFVKLNAPSANPETVANMERKFPSMVRQLAAGAFERIGKPFDEFLKNGGRWNLLLQPLTDVHLGSTDIYSSHITHGNPTAVRIFAATALLILVLACINAMNLATAQALRRSKEVGVKKVLGSARKQLMMQFLVESALFSLLAIVIAVLLVCGLLPSFNQLTGKSFSMASILTMQHVWALLTLLIVTALLSGLYPAVYLTRFKPAAIFKSNANPASIFSERLIRDGLVVFQFAISTTLIIASIIIYQQLRYTNEADLGFDKEHVLLLNQVEKIGPANQPLTAELRGIPGIQSASLSTGVPSKSSFGDFYVPEPTAQAPDVVKDIPLNSFMADEHFTATMGMDMVFGRAFSPDFNDSTSVILNETAVRQIGWTPETAVSKHLQYPGNGNQRFEVIGVVRDFNSESLHTSIMPFALFHFSSKTFYPRQLYIAVRLEAGQYQQTLQHLKDRWQAFTTAVPYNATFMDDELEALYRADQQAGFTFGIFTLLSVLIGCIGLFGLVTATTARRVKEIGIRKVLGASVSSVVTLLSKDFVKLVLIAIVIASPVAWWAMNQWLADFAYRIDIEWWTFVVAGLGAITIALLTVGWQAIRVAIANPVESLRDE